MSQPTMQGQPPAQKAQNAAYSAATTKLREKYRDEYNALVDAEFAARGLQRKRRASSEQRAARIKKEKLDKATAKIKKLYVDYPELRNQQLY